MIVIVMGVSGSGKSFVGNKLAEATGWPFAEGDDYHSAANKAKMHTGIPLTDEDRLPWLNALHQAMLDWQTAGQSGILACSALKASYRELLSAGIEKLRYVWLDPPRAVLEERMKNRPGHFMPVALLDSQLATLETPGGEGRVLRLDGLQPIEREIHTILEWLDEND